MDEGTGPKTLLFIHGLANYAVVWKKNIAYLKDQYRCVAIDLPGNGLSDKNDHKFTMAFFADTVYHLIQELDLKNVVLVGHSMGGQVAMTALLKHPKCAEGLILCAPAGFEPFTALDKTLYYATLYMLDHISSDEHSLRKTIETSFYNNYKQGESIVAELVSLMRTYKPGYYRKMVEACIRSMLEEPVLKRLGEINVPALVLFGKRDALIPNKLIHHTTTEQVAHEGAKQIPNCILQMIPDCGHFVQWEKADFVNGSIAEWLNDLMTQ